MQSTGIKYLVTAPELSIQRDLPILRVTVIMFRDMVESVILLKDEA